MRTTRSSVLAARGLRHSGISILLLLLRAKRGEPELLLQHDDEGYGEPDGEERAVSYDDHGEQHDVDIGVVPEHGGRDDERLHARADDHGCREQRNCAAGAQVEALAPPLTWADRFGAV